MQVFHPAAAAAKRLYIQPLADAGAFFFFQNDSRGIPESTNNASRVLKVLKKEPSAFADLMLSTEQFGRDDMLIAISGPAIEEDDPSISLNDMAELASLGLPRTVEHRREDGERRLIFRAPRTSLIVEMVLGGPFTLDPWTSALSVSGLDGTRFAELPRPIMDKIRDKAIGKLVEEGGTSEEVILADILGQWG